MDIGIDLHSFFFFSSRRRHTRCLSDWSSDVCSSDLDEELLVVADVGELNARQQVERPVMNTSFPEILGDAAARRQRPFPVAKLLRFDRDGTGGNERKRRDR